MHTLGKVLLGFIAVLAIAALFLTSMLYDAQQTWQQRVEDRQAKRDDLTEQVRQKELVVRDLEAEVNRKMTPWGRAWELGPQEIQLLDPDAGTIFLALGTNRELAHRELSQGKPLPTIYLFGRNEDGTSNYIGAFRLTAVEADQSTAQMIRKPYEGEVEQWQALAGVRVWEGIPSNWRALHAELQGETAIALQQRVEYEARLETQKLLVSKSEEQLQRRMEQLEGDPDPVEGAGPDTVDGLVVAIRNEETARNEQLAELDRLRHEYTEKYNQLTELLEQNRQLESELPQPSSDESSSQEPAVGAVVDPLRLR